MTAEALPAGFADPTREAARAFRRLLDAMARPGTRHPLDGVAPPEGLSPAAGTALLTLVDLDTPLWLPPRLSGGAVAEWITFYANAPRAGTPGTAAFAVGRWEELAPLDAWPAGEELHPDRGTTLVIELDALSGGPVRRLSGPGIDGVRETALPLPDDLVAAREAARALYPLGHDLILAAGGEITALPRTTRIVGG